MAREAEGNPYQPDGAARVGPQAVLEKLFMRIGSEWDGFTVTVRMLHDAGEHVVMEGPRLTRTILGDSMDSGGSLERSTTAPHLLFRLKRTEASAYGSSPDASLARAAHRQRAGGNEVDSCMRLVTPSVQWQSAFLEMARECEAAGEHRYALALRDFDAYLQKVEAGRRGHSLPGWVPGTEFWLEHGGQIIGGTRLRLRLTPDLENEGGHVGYDVRPSMRRLGHGTALLRLALAEARALGLERVRVTCDDDNIGSIKVIERNGGALAGLGVSKETGKLVRQYWIE